MADSRNKNGGVLKFINYSTVPGAWKVETPGDERTRTLSLRLRATESVFRAKEKDGVSCVVCRVTLSALSKPVNHR